MKQLTCPSQSYNVTIMNTYKKAGIRREQILSAACGLAEETHYQQVRRHHLVKLCGTAAGNITRLTGSMDGLRTLLIEYALKHDRQLVIAQAVADKHPAVEHLDRDTKVSMLGMLV